MFESCKRQYARGGHLTFLRLISGTPSWTNLCLTITITSLLFVLIMVLHETDLEKKEIKLEVKKTKEELNDPQNGKKDICA